MTDQAALLAELSASLGRRGIAVELRGRPVAEVAAEVRQAVRARDRGATVLVALSSFDLVDYVRGLLRLLDGLPPAARHAWDASFTRARYLAGDHRRFARAVPCELVSSPAGAIAWMGPPLSSRHRAVERMLRPLVTGTFVRPPDATVGPEDGPTRRRLELRIATSRIASLASYLVALGHTLAESFVLGVLGRDSEIAIRHVEQLAELPADRRYARVEIDPLDPERLVLATCVSPCVAGKEP
ncbi:MAG TPA: DUF6182 family protein [Kofleriaceae bacterium]|nr:DUF6182 family protein [Kofleriaceae bacterium]